MIPSFMEDIVSQAEEEGVTLAEVISRSMSDDDIREMQIKLSREISEGFRSVEQFMRDVEVPSIDEIIALQDAGAVETQALASDGPAMD